MDQIGSNKPRLVKTGGAKENQATSKSAPEWMVAAQEHLLTQDLGAEWRSCVMAWVALEQHLEYGQRLKVCPLRYSMTSSLFY